MNQCGGCGRDIDPEAIPLGSKYLCSRCYHLEVCGERPPHSMRKKTFLATVVVCLCLIAAAGIALCILYLLGTGNRSWFTLLSLLFAGVVACPAALLWRLRNVALLITALYMPLGLWSQVWNRAPGMEWLYSTMTSWGSYFFFLIGFIALIFFLHDLRALPRA